MKLKFSMTDEDFFDVIIIGGSYAGLAAGMALGRAMRKVLIIDDRKPCNRQTPHSHNFLTNDGRTPAEIAAVAYLQISKYETVQFFNDTATKAVATGKGFDIEVATGQIFGGKKLIFATGIKDILPAIEGLTECWGISVIHCPFCHGYEVRNERTGILVNGDNAFDFTVLISNWTKELTLFTNGTSPLSAAQLKKLKQHDIDIISKRIKKVKHSDGKIEYIEFEDGTTYRAKVLYAPSPFEQHCKIPVTLGCEQTEEGYITIDHQSETNVSGVFACGDNAGRMRTVANAVSMGTAAGIIVSRKIISENF